MTPELKLHLYREMVRIRRFEQGCLRVYQTAVSIGGFLDVTLGQEGLPVVVRSLVGKNDHTITGPRGLGAALACGLSMEMMFSELFGLAGGCNSGKGGMFSFFAPQYNHWGCHATVAAQTPLALGFAYANKYQGKEGVAFCILGDGAINQGVFHETLNMAALYELPIVFIIENNQFGMGTSVERASAFRDHLAQRAEAYGIDWDLADGWRLEDLHAKLSVARERAATKSKPTVIEVSTYRWEGFSIAEANKERYRTREEILFHKTHRDPIKTWEDTLTAAGLLDETKIQRINQEVKLEVETARDRAMHGPFPTEEDITRHVYWEVDNDTAAGKQGRHFF